GLQRTHGAPGLVDRARDRVVALLGLARLLGALGRALDHALRAAVELGERGLDLRRRIRGAARQRLDLRGGHREALAGVAGARRLDRRVERQQVGLARDRVDVGGDLADALQRRAQALGVGADLRDDLGQTGDRLQGLVEDAARRRHLLVRAHRDAL